LRAISLQLILPCGNQAALVSLDLRHQTRIRSSVHAWGALGHRKHQAVARIQPATQTIGPVHLAQQSALPLARIGQRSARSAAPAVPHLAIQQVSVAGAGRALEDGPLTTKAAGPPEHGQSLLTLQRRC